MSVRMTNATPRVIYCPSILAGSIAVNDRVAAVGRQNRKSLRSLSAEAGCFRPDHRKTYYRKEEQSIGRWWIYVARQNNVGSTLVYEAFSKQPLSFSIILTRSARDCARIFSIARLR